jgi:hypothetical protein
MNHNVKIASLCPPLTAVTLVRQLQACTALHPGWYGYQQTPPNLAAAGSVTVLTREKTHTATAVASGTWSGSCEYAAKAAPPSLAATPGALSHPGAPFYTHTPTKPAAFHPDDGDGFGCAHCRFLNGDFQVVVEVCPSPWTRPGPHPGESEEVEEFACKRAHCLLGLLEASIPLLIKTGTPSSIIDSSQVLVAQYPVGLGNEFELFLRQRVSRVAIRVITQGEFTEPLLDLPETGASRQAENPVVVTLTHKQDHGSRTGCSSPAVYR